MSPAPVTLCLAGITAALAAAALAVWALASGRGAAALALTLLPLVAGSGLAIASLLHIGRELDAEVEETGRLFATRGASPAETREAGVARTGHAAHRGAWLSRRKTRGGVGLRAGT